MAAVDYFLKIDGIAGESADREHKDEIEVFSFSWGVTQTAASHAGGAGAGKANVSDFNFMTGFSKASPKLFKACATGQHIKQAVLTGRSRAASERGGRGRSRAGGEGVFQTIKLYDIIVSSYQQSASAGDSLPAESLSLNFAKIEFSDAVFDARQKAGG